MWPNKGSETKPLHNLWVSLTWVIPEPNMLICGSFFILAETPFHVVPHTLELQTTTTAKKKVQFTFLACSKQ